MSTRANVETTHCADASCAVTHANTAARIIRALTQRGRRRAAITERSGEGGRGEHVGILARCMGRYRKDATPVNFAHSSCDAARRQAPLRAARQRRIGAHPAAPVLLGRSTHDGLEVGAAKGPVVACGERRLPSSLLLLLTDARRALRFSLTQRRPPFRAALTTTTAQLRRTRSRRRGTWLRS